MLTKKQDKNVRKWIKALESGKYKQTTNMLHKTDGTFCCLGVACDLIKGRLNKVKKGYAFEYDGHRASLPRSVMQEFGLESGGFIINTTNVGSFSIAGLNDTTFDPEYPDYTNVLPAIYDWYDSNKYIKPKQNRKRRTKNG